MGIPPIGQARGGAAGRIAGPSPGTAFNADVADREPTAVAPERAEQVELRNFISLTLRKSAAKRAWLNREMCAALPIRLRNS